MKKNKIYILTAFLYVFTIFIMFFVNTAAADYIVSTQSDLQGALNSAANGNVIEISQNVSLTATLTVNKSLKFTGNNVKLMVDGDFRHFSITGSDIIVSFEGVELIGRKTAPDDILNPGGGITSSAANLTLSGAVVKDCYQTKSGGGFYTTAVTNMVDCSFTGNSADPNQDPTKSGIQAGGGIYTTKKMTLNNTMLSGNSAFDGGGIAVNGNDSHLSLIQCKITGNTAVGNGGTWPNDRGGAGIWTNGTGAAVYAENTEISSNISAGCGGGIVTCSADAHVTLSDCTVSKNTAQKGGGILMGSGSFTVTDGIIGDNQATSNGGGMYATNTTVKIEQGAKILRNQGSGGGGIYTTGNSTVTINGGELSNNRAANGHGGAVCTAGTGGTITMTSGTVSYNEAAHATNGGGGAFASEQGNSAVTISGGMVSNNKSSHNGGAIYSYNSAVTIKGTAQIISNNAVSAHGGAVYIYGSAPVYIQDKAAIKNNTAALNGGAVHTAGSNALINMSGGLVENNISQQHGGAFSTSVAGANIFVTGGSVTGNRSSQNGGAIFSYHALVDIQNATITGNKAGTYGGAIHLNEKDATLKVLESTISDNEAKEGGAVCAIRNYDFTGNPVVSIVSSVMEKNKATAGSGGAVSTLGNYAIVSVSSSKLDANTAAHNGGAIYTGGLAGGAHVVCINAKITDNVSDERGGGIFVSSGNFTMDGTQSAISGNTTKNSGGGVYIGGITAIAGIKQGKITGNKSINGDGGGIYIPALANLTVESDAQFSNNSAVKSYMWTLDPTGMSYFTGLHNQNIKTASFTAPFTNLYNNYDVNFSAYSILYKSNGSGETDISIAYQKDEVATIIPNPFHYTGKVFASWNTAADATGMLYNPGDTITMGTKDVVLYAQWDNALNAVMFDTKGGTPVPPIQVVYYGSSITTPTAPTLAGNNFTGWYKDEACKELWDFDNDVVVADITLHAGWDKEMHTVHFNSNGGSSVGSINVPYGELIPAPTDPILKGNSFAGWYKDEALNDPWHFDYDVVTQDITLYAKWIAENKLIYTVTYKPNGAAGNDVITVHEDNTTAVVLSNPFERSGYSFVEWNTSETGEGVAYTTGEEVLMHDNLVLYAQWIYTGHVSNDTASLTVECIDENEKMIYTITTTETVGTDVNAAAPIISGYELNDSAEKTVLIQTGENILIFTYKKIPSPPNSTPPKEPSKELEPPESKKPNEKSPQTGEPNAFAYWIIAFSTLLVMIMLLLLKRYRKRI